MVHVDIFLTCLSVVCLGFVWYCSVYGVLYFHHPNEGPNKIYKLFCVCNVFDSLSVQVVMCTLAVVNIFLVPLDVGSRGSRWHGLPMFALWAANYSLMMLFGLLLVPWSIIYLSESALHNGYNNDTSRITAEETRGANVALPLWRWALYCFCGSLPWLLDTSS